MSEVWFLRLLRWAYVAFIAAASGVGIQAGLQGSGEGSHSAHTVLALAVPELLAAFAFLVERIEFGACGVLLLVYAAATVLSLASGDFVAPLRFFYFAITAIYIVHAHGNLRSQNQSLSAKV